MKTITFIPLLALLAVTGCGNHTTDNQSGPGSAPPASAPAGMGDTNTPPVSKLPEIPPPQAAPPPAPALAPTPPPAPAPAMTSPDVDTNAPVMTNNPSATNQSSSS